MKQLYVLFLFLVVIQLNTKAQRNFKPGYVVSLSGDTTKGFVDYREWDQNPRNITFSRTLQTGNTSVHTVADIKAFGVNTFETYKAYNVSISKNGTETVTLNSIMDTTAATERVFLRIIATGKNVTLFQYTDDLKDHFYISDGSSDPVELKHYRYLDPKQVNKITTIKTYGQQLQRLVALYQPGNRILIEQVQRAEYRLNDLTKIAFAINGAEKTQKSIAVNRTATVFFVGIAANASHVAYEYSSVRSNTSIFPQLNAGFNFFFNKNVRKLLFRTELNLTGSKADAQNTITDLSGTFSERLTFNQLTASLVPQVIYNIYNTDKVKVFLGLGMPVNFSSYSNLKYFVGTTQYDISTPPKTYISMAGKAGVTFKSFEIYAAYNKPLSDFIGLDVTRHSYQLGINYFLK